MSTTGKRKPAEQRQTMDHRIAMRHLRELHAKREALTLQIHEATRAEAVYRRLLSDRLGITVPFDPSGVLYDILARVEVMPDGGWRWLGVTNNKNLPVVKFGGFERSVVCYLAIQFGVVPEDFVGVLYPQTRHKTRGYVDVNPYHRTLGPFPDGATLGNPDRHRAAS